MKYTDRVFLAKLYDIQIEFTVIEEVTEDLDHGPIYLCVSEENKTFYMTENDLDRLLVDGRIQEVTTHA